MSKNSLNMSKSLKSQQKWICDQYVCENIFLTKLYLTNENKHKLDENSK